MRFLRQTYGEPVGSVLFSQPEVWYTCAMSFRVWLRAMRADTAEARTRQLYLLLALILAALALRMARLAFQPLWWDEGWSLYFATTGIQTMLERTAVDIHPPLYYLLLHFWIRLFGPSVVSVRSLSVVIGTATLPFLYLVAKRLLGPIGAFLATLLLAISPFHVYYSQEVRMYALVTLLALVATTFALQWDLARGRWGTWLGYVLAATAALYTQYYAGFLLVALNLVILARWRGYRHPVRHLGSWLGAQGVVALLFLPWLVTAGGKLVTYVRFKVSVEGDPSLGFFSYMARHLSAFTWGHAEGFLEEWWWLGLLPVVVLLIAAVLALWKRPLGLKGAGDSPGWKLSTSVLLATPLLCGFAVNLVFPFNPPQSERLLLLALPAYLILVSGLSLDIARHRRALATAAIACFVAAAVVSLGVYYTVPRHAEDDYRPLIDQVRALGLQSDAILAVHPWQVGYFYGYMPEDDTRPTLVLTPREVIPRERQLWADDPASMTTELDRLLAQHGRLWLLDHRTMGRVLEAQIEAHLIEEAYPVFSEWHGPNTVLSLFADGAPVLQPARARFDEWLSLESAATSPGPLEAGWGVVAVELGWELAERPGDEATIGLRLTDPTGYVWAQRDTLPGGGQQPFSEWPVGQTRLDRHGLLVPAGTPPGDYEIRLRVYRSADLAALPATFSGRTGGEVTLGPVRVVRPQRTLPIEALDMAQSLRLDFGERFRFLGYTLDNGSPRLPGETVTVELLWQALSEPGEDFLPRLQLLDQEGRSVAELTEKPVEGRYPTAWWQADELVRDPHRLPIPAAVPPGHYRLSLSMVRAANGQPLETPEGQTAVELGEIEVGSREYRFEPTHPQHDQVAALGSSVEMVGYDLAEVVRAPGSPLAVTLHWHALETPDRSYHVFVHLLDADGELVAQDDGPPAGGQVPALGWLPGEYILDPRRLELPQDLPEGVYRLSVGLYDPVTYERPAEGIHLDTPVEVSVNGCLCP